MNLPSEKALADKVKAIAGDLVGVLKKHLPGEKDRTLLDLALAKSALVMVETFVDADLANLGVDAGEILRLERIVTPVAQDAVEKVQAAAKASRAEGSR